MAKTGMIERNDKRRRMCARDAQKRAELKEIANNKELPMEERFAARLKLAQLPRNGSPTRSAQSLRGNGPSAWLLPQDENVAHCAARSGQSRGLSPVW